MKKLAIGCALVMLVALVVAGGGAFFLWQRYVKPMTGTIAEFSQFADIEKQVRNTSAFAAPAAGELTEDMVKRFASVQETMQARLGPRLDQLKAKYKAIDTERRRASFVEAVNAVKDLSGTLVEAKRVQVEALNRAGFSVKEYEWIRTKVYAAAGMVTSGLDLKNIQKMATEAGRGQARAPEETVSEEPARNRELVAPYRKKLQEWVPLAYFGL